MGTEASPASPIPAPTYSGARRAVPTVLQMEAVECGAAALAMVLAHHGRWETLETLRVACGVSRDGSKASNICKAARGLGMAANGKMAIRDRVFTMGPMPAVVFWNFNHFVVLEGVRGDRVYLNDPAFGPRRLSKEEFFKSYSRVALYFEPEDSFQRAGSPPSLIGNLRRRLTGSGDALRMVMAVTLLLVLPGLIQPALLKAFVDGVLVETMTGWILPLAIGLGLAGLVNGLLTWLQQHYLLATRNKLALSSAGELVHHLLRLPMLFHTQRQAGDVAARVEGCSRVSNLLSGPLSTNLANGAMVGFYALVMAVISPVLALAVVGLSALNALAVKLVQRKRTDLNGRLLNRRARMQAIAVNGLSAMETLKASGTEHDFFTKWSGEHAHVTETQQEMGAISFALDAVPSLLNQLLTAVVLGGGGWLIMRGDMTIGGLVAFQALLGRFTGPIQQLVSFSSQLQEIKGDLTRIDDALRYEVDPLVSAAVAPAPDEGKLSGGLELRNVSFRHGPLDPLLIEDFSLTLRPGGRVALVGGSGSGKSTLARVIVGLNRPESGAVIFDGRPLETIPREVFTESVGHVDQEVHVFAGTVNENIALWDPALPQEAIVQAAKDARIHDVIASRPGGYEGEVAEGGGNFSGGQLQRLEIARALAKSPRLLVLDEATSALDPVTEREIDRALRRRGVACIIVAHRLSTVRDADEIIVLDHGQVVERGTHESLMAAQGRYAQLVAQA